VVVYADRLGTEELLLASVASHIVMPEAGSVFLVGLRAESFFLKGLLDRLGVQPDVVRIGDFKNAAETFTRSSMSESQREQLEEMLDDRFAVLVEGLSEGRGLAPAKVRDLIDRGPYGATAALEAGLIDRCLFPDEVEGLLGDLSGVSASEGPVPVVDARRYNAWRGNDSGWAPWLRELPRIAYVVAAGMIRHGSGGRGVASDAYRHLLHQLQKDRAVRGVVLRVESPGGDALASDLLWRSVERLRTEKPVVVSMGEVAASGGYYLAAAADAIVAEGTTLTGSIGVVGGKVDLTGLFERAGVASDAVERGARAGLLTPSRSFSPEERAVVRDEMLTMYDRFLDRVAEGRGLARESVRAVASGRIWTGRQARAHGLVDLLGGPLEALAEVRRRVGLAPGEAHRVELHPRRPRLGGLLSAIQREWWLG
jgi:protease-4